MRLLNTTTFHPKFFMDIKERPEYAILSHCWGEDEVAYAQLQNESYDRTWQGWRKIEECCRLAKSQGLEWAWIDTCCIDKSSSAELTEAINSMFAWYRDARVCYAFLWDVHCSYLPECTSIEMYNTWKANLSTESQMEVQTFMDSRWFTRGWTLQELIAPAEVYFYSSNMKLIGTKSPLRAVLVGITTIDMEYLMEGKADEQSNTLDAMENGPVTLTGRSFRSASIAQRMSCVSQRRTTRCEDLAYCLLGLFDVNMPMLYGEGEKAFLRLQLEIIKQSSDRTIFAWEDDIGEGDLCSVFAQRPAQFRGCQDVESSCDSTIRQADYYTTNHGLRLTYTILPSDLRTGLALFSMGRASISIGYRRPRHAVSRVKRSAMAEIRLELESDNSSHWYRKGLHYRVKSRFLNFLDRASYLLAPARHLTLVHVGDEPQNANPSESEVGEFAALYLMFWYTRLFGLIVPITLIAVPSRFYGDSRFGWSVLTLLTLLANDVALLKLCILIIAFGWGIVAVSLGI